MAPRPPTASTTGRRRLFGTDGVRGVANIDLDVPLVLDLARAAGELIGGGAVVVGRDTRRSGDMLAAGLQAGFHSVGVDTLDAGIIPVGGVSFLIPEVGARLGVMVSASHNPAPDNGVKFFDATGAKLDDEREAEIEGRLREGEPWKAPTGAGVGVAQAIPDATDRYVAAISEDAGGSLEGLRLALDCANGAASTAAPELFASLGADVVSHFDSPDGLNINEACGATTPRYLAEVAGGRLGLSFDGDADRLMVVDEDGRVANGDVILAVIARHLKECGELPGNRVVTTVMSNLGFRKAMHEAGIQLTETRVGDRYVMEAMLAEGAVLGGEQSGHVIQLDRARTGDGLRTALRLLDVMTATGRTLADLRHEALVEFPQVLENVRVRSKDLEGADRVWEAVRAAERELGDEGRVLVRASGTEPVVRVMVEAPTMAVATHVAQRLTEVVADQLA
ncbi:MAG: phosphoglucosamine mutase [bacterium]|nr:phosphoglucosamine mutase [bacterium]MDE0439006.1 phosphoglucosamine mutase [bacterium]